MGNLIGSMSGGRPLVVAVSLALVLGLGLAGTVAMLPRGERPAAAQEAKERTKSGGASIPVRVVAAETTALRQTATLTGDFQPTARVQIVSRLSARVTKLPVDVGATVAAGATLAELDRAGLEAALQQVQAQAAVARANLKKVEAGARPEDVAAAAAAAKQAAERLTAARAQAGDMRAQDLATAQAAVAAAAARLRQVTQGPTAADIANAQATVEAAEARLRAANEGATEADREAARAAVRGAQARYEQVLAGAKPQDIDIAVQALTQAKENRLKLESALSFAKEQARLGMDQAASAVRAAQATYAAAKLVYDEAVRTGKDPNIPSESCPKLPSGKRTNCNELSDPKLRQYKAAYESAEQVLRQAEAMLETRRLAFEDAKTQEIVGLQAAGAQVQSAQAQLDKLKAGATPEEIAAAKALVDQAQAQLDKLEGPARETDIAAAQAAVDQARAGLAKVNQPAREPEIAAAQAAVLQARASLAKLQASPTEVGAAQAILEQQEALALKATNPFLPSDLEAAQAQVLVAEAAVTAAEVNLRDATLVAPFAGVVAARHVSEGALAAPGAVLLEVISADVRGVFTVEENQIGLIQIGQPATLTTSAYPGERFPGSVSIVNPTANASTRSFGLKITPRAGAGLLKAGMFAQAELVTQTKQDALAVPEDAIVTRDGKSIVFIVVDGKARQREVATGLRADGKVELTSGVQAGEQVVVVGQNLLNDGDAVTVRP